MSIPANTGDNLGRDIEDAADAMGVNTARYKLNIFQILIINEQYIIYRLIFMNLSHQK